MPGYINFHLFDDTSGVVIVKNSDMPAMPIVTPDMPVEGSGGLTKLEHFAGLAMQGILSCPAYQKWNKEEIAEGAVIFAKALLEELEKQK